MNQLPEQEQLTEETGETKALRKKQRREARNAEREADQATAARQRRLWKYAAWLVPLAVVAWLGWRVAAAPTVSDDEQRVSELERCVQHGGVGMHIHPHLSISIRGEAVALPENIGISAGCMRPIHTHDSTGTLHLEFPRQRDVLLGDFFHVWEKQFSSQCVLEHCNGEASTVKMLVNGVENTEFENYHMKDGDRIEIRYD